MDEIMNLAQEAASEADETDEQRADRLNTAATEAGVDPETLYKLEQEIRGFIRYEMGRNPDEMEDLEQFAAQLAPWLGIDPTQVDRMLVSLGGQYATGSPAKTAYLVRTLDEALDRSGLYDELDVETPTRGDLRDPVDVGE